jgi:hypothetical protein
LHKLSKGREVVSVFVFSIELDDRLLVESRHLHAVDFKALLVDRVDDLAHAHISVRLDGSESSLTLVFKMVSSVHISVVHHLKNSSHNCHLGALEEIIELHHGDLLSLEERSLVLAVEHLD